VFAFAICLLVLLLPWLIAGVASLLLGVTAPPAVRTSGRWLSSAGMVLLVYALAQIPASILAAFAVRLLSGQAYGPWLFLAAVIQANFAWILAFLALGRALYRVRHPTELDQEAGREPDPRAAR
jgi:hypothetical protein